MANLVLNPGFEDYTPGSPPDFDDWTEYEGDGDLTVSGDSHGGAAALQLAYVTGASHVYQNVSVTALSSYIYSFWTRGDGSQAGRYAVWDLDNIGWILDPRTTGVSGTSYVEVSEQFVAPAGCATVVVYVFSHDAYESFARFDDVYLAAVVVPRAMSSYRRRRT